MYRYGEDHYLANSRLSGATKAVEHHESTIDRGTHARNATRGVTALGGVGTAVVYGVAASAISLQILAMIAVYSVLIAYFAGPIADFSLGCLDESRFNKTVKRGEIIRVPQPIIELCAGEFERNGVAFEPDDLDGEFPLVKSAIVSLEKLSNELANEESKALVRASIVDDFRSLALDKVRAIESANEGRAVESASLNAGLQAAFGLPELCA